MLKFEKLKKYIVFNKLRMRMKPKKNVFIKFTCFK